MHVAKKVAGGLLVGGERHRLLVGHPSRAQAQAQEAKADSAHGGGRGPDRAGSLGARDVAQALNDGRWQRPAAYAAGAWAIFKVAEVRQLRRMNKLLASRT